MNNITPKKENYVEIQGIKFKATGKVLTPDNEHVRQYLSDAKKGRKLRKK